MQQSIEAAKDRSFFKDPKLIQDYTEKCLANPDLSAREKIQLMHFNQKKRLNILVQLQQHTFDYVFKRNPDEFFTTRYHYDWWIFPMHVPQEWRWEQRNYDASINLGEAHTLLQDERFVDTYINSVAMYIAALKKHGWNNYPVRYARMLHSIALFLQAAQEKIPVEIYTRLYEQAKNAIVYAEEHVLPDREDYVLLRTGHRSVLSQLKIYEQMEHLKEDKAAGGLLRSLFSFVLK